MKFASSYVHPLDRPPEKTLEGVIVESTRRARVKKMHGNYLAQRTEVVRAAEARRYPEAELQPLPPVPVTSDETGQLGWELEPGWPK